MSYPVLPVHSLLFREPSHPAKTAEVRLGEGRPFFVGTVACGNGNTRGSGYLGEFAKFQLLIKMTS